MISASNFRQREQVRKAQGERIDWQLQAGIGAGLDDAEAHDAVDLALLLQTVCDMVGHGGTIELLDHSPRASGTVVAASAG
jgi:hypothetical protein